MIRIPKRRRASRKASSSLTTTIGSCAIDAAATQRCFEAAHRSHHDQLQFPFLQPSNALAATLLVAELETRPLRSKSDIQACLRHVDADEPFEVFEENGSAPRKPRPRQALSHSSSCRAGGNMQAPHPPGASLIAGVVALRALPSENGKSVALADLGGRARDTCLHEGCALASRGISFVAAARLARL